MVFAGRISYGLYVYHALVQIAFNRWLPPPLRFLLTDPSLRLMTLGMATLAVAAISWRVLEQPVNRFRTKLTRATLGPVPIEEENTNIQPQRRARDVSAGVTARHKFV